MHGMWLIFYDTFDLLKVRHRRKNGIPWNPWSPIRVASNMMMSSNGNIFRVTGLCEGSLPVTCGFPSHRPVTRSFDASFKLRLKKGTTSCDDDLRGHRAHYDVTVMKQYSQRSADEVSQPVACQYNIMHIDILPHRVINCFGGKNTTFPHICNTSNKQCSCSSISVHLFIKRVHLTHTHIYISTFQMLTLLKKYLYCQSQCSKTWDSKCLALIPQMVRAFGMYPKFGG